MAQSTTIVTACDVNVWLDSGAGTPVDISGVTNSVTLNFSQNVDAQHTFGSRWPVRFMCGKDANFSLVVFYSTATDEGLDILRDWFFANDSADARTLTVYIPTKDVGWDRYQAEVVLESLDIPATAGEATPITVTASLLPTGAVTHSQSAT